MAPDTETGLGYRGFKIVYATPQFDVSISLHAFLLNIEDFEESCDEED